MCHPKSYSSFNDGNTHPKKTVPDRSGGGKNPGQLEDRRWDLQDRASKGNKDEPEQPPPMAHNTKNQDANKNDKAHQEQRRGQGIAVSRG